MKNNAIKTNTQFKVGDKVYVDPGPMSLMENYIRATITGLDETNNGYLLRAFEQDLPGIHMFNIWDKDLVLRSNKAVKRIPDDARGEDWSCGFREQNVD